MKVNIYTALSPNSVSKIYKTADISKVEQHIKKFLKDCPGGKVEVMLANEAPVAAVNKLVPFPPLCDEQQFFPCERNGISLASVR